MSNISNSRLFVACCIALAVTAMSFGIRVGILGELGAQFNLNNEQLGWITFMAFTGFPIATLVCGILYNYIGPKNIMYIAFAAHMIGLIWTIFAGGFWSLLISTFFVGFANGAVEAGCNPLIADIYHKNKTTMLNKFHVWFPGGIVIGALASALITEVNGGWQIQIAFMIVPTIVYGILIFGKTFPAMRHSILDSATNLKSMFHPLFIFMCVCMTITATTELGTQQWIERILSSSGAHPMLVLAMVTGVMALGRFFAGPIVHKLNPPGVLFMSAVITTIGIYLMSIASGALLVYLSALVFAVGVTYFWPTMIGFIGEYMPQTGAIGMSVIGGVGMMGLGWWQPVIGKWMDKATEAAVAKGLTGDEVSLEAGRATLDNLALFPIALIIAFGILLFVVKPKKKMVTEEEATAANAA